MDGAARGCNAVIADRFAPGRGADRAGRDACHATAPKGQPRPLCTGRGWKPLRVPAARHLLREESRGRSARLHSTHSAVVAQGTRCCGDTRRTSRAARRTRRSFLRAPCRCQALQESGCLAGHATGVPWLSVRPTSRRAPVQSALRAPGQRSARHVRRCSCKSDRCPPHVQAPPATVREQDVAHEQRSRTPRAPELGRSAEMGEATRTLVLKS